MCKLSFHKWKSEYANLIKTMLIVILCNPKTIMLQMLFLLWLGGLNPFLMVAYFSFIVVVALWNEDRAIKRRYGI
ncbi:MAG: hypothetical protein Q6356_003205 [Candidatus Wukongarchaeota archaeon]|nr:hypothetical protein [Candidatus Wukongarchaeota archaeon]